MGPSAAPALLGETAVRGISVPLPLARVCVSVPAPRAADRAARVRLLRGSAVTVLGRVFPLVRDAGAYPPPPPRTQATRTGLCWGCASVPASAAHSRTRQDSVVVQ